MHPERHTTPPDSFRLSADWTCRDLDARPSDHALDLLADLLIDLEETSQNQAAEAISTND